MTILKKKDEFGTFHPIVGFGFFCAVIIFGMIFMNPVLLVISFLGSVSYGIYIEGKKAFFFIFTISLPMIIISAIINSLFNHRGVTIIFYMFENPITLESIFYGFMTGLMFAGIIMWFYSYNRVITSDKFMHLFGKIIPSLSLIFSMVLRLVPRFINQAKIISKGQKSIGRDVSNKGFKDKIKYGSKILSILITWAFENSIDTASSMRARGYGLKGRSHYLKYRFDNRDKVIGILILILIVIVIIGGVLGENNIEYFPILIFNRIDFMSLIIYISYTILCFLPVIINYVEDIKWQHLKSQI